MLHYSLARESGGIKNGIAFLLSSSLEFNNRFLPNKAAIRIGGGLSEFGTK